MGEEGFTASFSRLCDIHSEPDTPAIVYHQRLLRQRHKRLLKKTLYNALLQFMPSQPCDHHEGSQLTDLDEIYSRAYVMRCQRKFGDAKKLEELTEGFLSAGDQREENKNLLRFLLCLADTGHVTDAIDFGHRQIKLPALLHNKVEMLPVDADFCHGDEVSLGVSSEHWFTVYPCELFEIPAMKESIPMQITSMPDTQIFERKPGNSLQGPAVFSIAGALGESYQSHRKLTLFGALTHCRDNDLQMSLDLPEIMTSCPARIVPPKLHDVSTDEGFDDARSEASRSASPVEDAVSSYEMDTGQCRVSIWTQALEATPSRHYVWEAAGRPCEVMERPYLTEAGPGVFDCLLEALMEQLRLLYPSIYLLQRSVISMSRLVTDAVNLLIGVQSTTFLYSKDVQQFHLSENILVSGLSSEALQEVCGALVECGTNYSRLKAFSESPAHDSLISRAFCSAVWRYLQHYSGCVLSLPCITTVLQLNMTIQPVAAQIRFLAKLCQCATDSEDGQLPAGVPLLSYVYTHTLHACSSPHYPMMLSLLNATCVPYVTFLQDWVFHGVCRDAYGEFMIQINDDFLVRRDKTYWLSGYKLVLPADAESVPLFLADMMTEIFTCGKTINLLRLISPQHFLFGIEYAVPRVMITFSQEKLVDIETQSQDYMLRVQQTASANTLNRKEKLLRAETAKHNLQIKARKKATEAIEKIQETVDAARRQEDGRKRELFAELKEQMERDLERRALTVAQVKERDRELVEAARERPWMQPGANEQVERAAREELIEKYAKLTDAATYREQKALWLVKRHKLDAKRTEYLQREAAHLMEELQQRPLVAGTGGGDAVDASQSDTTKQQTNIPETPGDSILQASAPAPPDGSIVGGVDAIGDDGLPNWARTRGTLAGSLTDLPTWARGADTDLSLSSSVSGDSGGLPQWARRGLRGEGREVGGDVLSGSDATDLGDSLKQSSEGDLLRQSSSGDILKLSDGDTAKHPVAGATQGHPSDATVGDLFKLSSDGDTMKYPTPVAGVTLGHPSDAVVGDLFKLSSDGDTAKHPTPVAGATQGHPSDATVGDLFKLSSDGDTMKHPTPVDGATQGHPSDATVGDLFKLSSDGDTMKHPTPVDGATQGHPSDATVGDLFKLSSDSDTMKHPTPVAGVTLGHPSDATVGDLFKLSSDGDTMKHPTPVDGATQGHPSDATVGDLFKLSSDGDTVKHPTPVAGVTLGHPSDVTVGNLLKESGDGDILKLSSRGGATVRHPTPGDITHPSSEVTLGHPSDAVVGDLLKQTSHGDNAGLSCDIVRHPAPGGAPKPFTGVVLGHPSDATAGDLLYPTVDTPDGQTPSEPSVTVEAREHTSDVTVGSSNHDQKETATVVQPAAEVSAQDIVPTSHVDAETRPAVAGVTDALSVVTRRHPHVGDESTPHVMKPGFFGHVSELAGADYTVTAPQSRFNATMHATKESDWTDFTVLCNRRRRVVGQDVTTETQQAVSQRPHIKMNRWIGASTESEHIDPNILRVKRFRELNDHQRHSSDSTVQTLLYGRKFGAIQDSQIIREEEEEVPREHMELWADTRVEPYEVNYDCLDDAPAVNLMSKMSEHTLFERDGFVTSDNVEAHEYVPLTSLINRSVMAPLTVQIKAVNESILSYFSVDLNIDQHFEALQQFLLLSDGEFSVSLTDQLFDKLSQGIQPQEMLNPVHLNGVLTRAMQYSLHGDSTYAKNVSFALKYFPSVLRQNAVDALDCLDLTYKVAWPLNIVITDTCLGKYSQVFSFMLQLKRVAWLTSDLWHKLKRDGLVSHTDRSTQYRQLQLYRHEMQHFVKVIQSYITNQIFDVTWHEFQQDLDQRVHSLDELHHVHQKYLNKCIFRCLLTPNAAVVMKVIHDIFTLILKFHTQLHLGAWSRSDDSKEMTHPHFEGMAKSYRAFNAYSNFFFKVVSRLAARGYQPHLQELVLRLNFNNYYSDNIRLTQQTPSR